MAHTALSAAFYLLHTVVGNGAMNKFGSCCQWRIELVKFYNQNVVFLYRQRRNECSGDIGNCTMMSVALD
jgi:hypothetical protein